MLKGGDISVYLQVILEANLGLYSLDISVYLQVILEANLGLYSLDAIEIIFVA